MKRITLAIAAALLATSAYATGPGNSGGNAPSGFAGSISASGFINTGQHGDWSAGAMNQSNAGVEARGRSVNTWSGSTSEGFGSNFRGATAAGGAGKAFGRFGRR